MKSKLEKRIETLEKKIAELEERISERRKFIPEDSEHGIVKDSEHCGNPFSK